MNPGYEAALRCPRCGYNLTGLPEPRCPECGQALDAAQLAAGCLRENIATRLDRCDPWQPHQVLLASLLELLHNAVRPGRVLRRMQLDGPWWSGGLMLVGGWMWTWLLSALGLGLAIALHAGVSPGAAAKAATMWWAPAVLWACTPVSIACGAGVVLAEWVVPSRSSRRGRRLRVFCYWTPVVTLWGAVPTAMLALAAPEFLFGTLAIGSALATIDSYVAASLARSATPNAGGGMRTLWPHVAAAGFALVVSPTLLPPTLEPPLWVYLIGG